jgi:TPR repeat protein
MQLRERSRILLLAGWLIAAISGCAAVPAVGPIAAADDASAGVLTPRRGPPVRIRYEDLSYSGNARFEWPDGRTYAGRFASGLPDGHGVEQLPDGTRYDGEWTEGRRSGAGSLVLADGNRYDGQFEAGVRSGRGVFQSDSGNYDGQWSADVPEGEGRFDYADGSVYQGAWSDGRRNGWGTYRRSDGSTYEGDWRNDVPDGFGEMTDPGGYVYAGGWRDGQRAGYGALEVGEEFGYTGTWVADRRQGYGLERSPDGSEYLGEWRADERHGEGTLRQRNGAYYEGTWEHNAPRGTGSLRTAEGIVVSGTWDGQFTTRGVLRLPSGQQFSGDLYDTKTQSVDAPFLRWLQRAGEQGDHHAQLLLGEAYRLFLQPAPDPEQAKRWYGLASAAGIAEAQFQIAQLMLENSGSAQRAIALLTAAAAQQHAGANLRLGTFYQLGTFVEKNAPLALRYYEVAVAQGDIVARNNLAWLLATSPDDGVRDGKRAVALVRPVAVLYEDWGHLDTLAAALAATGDFPSAIATQQQAVHLAETAQDIDAETLQDLRERLTLFQRAEPYREP